MKVVLVRPPFIDVRTGPPIGFAFLSKVLKDAGHEVVIFDINLKLRNKYIIYRKYTRDFTIPKSSPLVKYAYKNLNRYCSQILALSPDLVGFYLSYPTVDFGIKIAKIISKSVRCIAGGPQASYHEKELLEMNFFKAIVSGYGEEAILLALHENGIISRPLIKDKEYLPDYSEMPQKKYGHRLPIITNRGCPRNCTFCTQHLSVFFHPIQSAIDQISNTANVKEIIINDSNINISTARTIKLFQNISKLKTRPKIHVFGLEVKKDYKKYLSLLADSGVKEIRIGIESGSINERNNMQKPFFTNDLVVSLISDLTKYKIKTWVQFIFCYPNQTFSDRKDTIKLMNDINVNSNIKYVQHLWYRFVIHHGKEQFFAENYGVTSVSPVLWFNSNYTPSKIEELEVIYSKLIPKNAKIYL